MCRRAVAVTTIILLALTPSKIHCSGRPFNLAYVKKLCKVASALTETASIARTKTDNQVTQAQAAAQASIMAELAAEAATDSNTSELLKAVALAASACAQEAIDNTKVITNVAIAATANAAKAAGHITEFLSFLRHVSASGTTGTCITKTSNDNAPDESSIQALGCPADVVETGTDKKDFDEAEIDAKGFKTLTANDATDSGSTKCYLLMATAGTSHVWQQARSNAPVMMGFTTVTSNSVGGNTGIKAETLHAMATDWEPTTKSGTINVLYDWLGKLKKAEVKGCGATRQAVLEKVISSPRVADLIKAVKKGGKLNAKGTDGDHEVKALLKKVLKVDQSHHEKINDVIESQSIKQVLDDNTKPTNMKETNTDSDIRKSLLLHRRLNREKLAELQRQLNEERAKTADTVTTKITETDATCEKKGKEDNCKDGCKEITENGEKKCVKDPDYKPKQVEGAKESVTATNTTGSNSFVIHKAPLLLAFFLLGVKFKYSTILRIVVPFYEIFYLANIFFIQPFYKNFAYYSNFEKNETFSKMCTIVTFGCKIHGVMKYGERVKKLVIF
ncbi:Trypanosome variant surface glycoprotein (A-type), putative [Trypanosoma equiperdum]|uniref:Trypanosome variant surface glycoprotein (A-type), putative n=1 Tax=Trypanosoma equiperdum TaxID=5694 RepID=A0A1G4I999_TRYEQ|nr:Trypanosome variant surface glycoprotein (A-type), putative [Trypanosoma equiperdum]